MDSDGYHLKSMDGMSGMKFDMAALTYSAHIALGDLFTGLFINDKDLLNHWMKADRESEEKEERKR